MLRGFIRCHPLRHPQEMGAKEVEAFLTWLAAERQVVVSTHNQALAALLFLYREVLEIDLPWLTEIGRPKSPERLPSVLSREEVGRLLAAMDGMTGSLARLIYGTGMRLMVALRLLVKDVDFERRLITVREGKGAKDRVVMLPDSLRQALKAQLASAQELWSADSAGGLPGVEMPEALPGKYPRAAQSWRGSGFGRRRPCRWTRARGLSVAITCTRSACSGRSGGRRAMQGLHGT